MKFEPTLQSISMSLIAIFTFVLSSCIKNPVDYVAPAIIEYTIAGGIAGIQEETIIDDNGLSELCHGGGFILHYQLTESQLYKLKSMFSEADFFNLRNEYVPSRPIMDGFYYSITYTTDSKTKTITAATGAKFPNELEKLIEMLHELNSIIRSNADAGTLLIRWEYTIKEWLFTNNIKLEDNLQNRVYTDGSEVFKEIFRFFKELQQNDINALFWEGDYLYEITVGWGGEENDDYFKVNRKHPVRYWPENFGFNISRIPEKGIILEGEILSVVSNLLEEDVTNFNIFIFDALRDGGKAVSLILISGKSINNSQM